MFDTHSKGDQNSLYTYKQPVNLNQKIEANSSTMGRMNQTSTHSLNPTARLIQAQTTNTA